MLMWLPMLQQVRQWQQMQQQLARAEGYVCTILGRRRQLPDARGGGSGAAMVRPLTPAVSLSAFWVGGIGIGLPHISTKIPHRKMQRLPHKNAGRQVSCFACLLTTEGLHLAQQRRTAHEGEFGGPSVKTRAN